MACPVKFLVLEIPIVFTNSNATTLPIEFLLTFTIAADDWLLAVLSLLATSTPM